jgi:hypothetical protein
MLHRLKIRGKSTPEGLSPRPKLDFCQGSGNDFAMAPPKMGRAHGGGVMDKLHWIKDLVLAEQQMEDSGMVDFSAGYDPAVNLELETVEYLRDLKAAFVESASAFNQLKGSTIGTLKIYGISNTRADFMLFRNGFKLIFSMSQPGSIKIYMNHIGSSFVPGMETPDATVSPQNSEDILSARWGAFGDLNWTYKDQAVKLDYLVRYYLSRFIKESAK